MRFALIAGELSGDILGAALIHALRARFPRATFYGVAGPRMVAAGCEAIESIEALSIMGIAEVLPALPRLLRLRARLVRRFAADRPDVVIGIDAPDFNLGLERRLRARGIRTVHVVSPTVWAWREGRIAGIARSADLLLCLFPFEPAYYDRHPAARAQGLRASYIGHPLAEELDDAVTPAEARRSLDLPGEGRVIAILPGSRGGELKYLGELFVRAAAWLQARSGEPLRFVTPIAKPRLRPGIESLIRAHAPNLAWTLVDGQSREAMRAADVVLLASGTATLECLLAGRPMVVAYRAARLTAWLMLDLGLFKARHFGLPNLLSAEPVVTELLQDQVTPESLGGAVERLLADPALRERQLEQFAAVRAELKRNAAERAAEAIAGLLQEHRQ